MARLLKADGTEEPVQAKGQRWTLAELQQLVGGDIEAPAWLAPLRLVWNEEGALRGLPLNTTAKRLVREMVLRAGRPLRMLPTIVGDVVLLEPDDQW